MGADTALLELLQAVPDFRARRGIRHGLAVLLAVALAAVLAGARSFAAIGEWAADTDAAILGKLGVISTRIPCEATLRRAVSGVDAAVLARIVGAFFVDPHRHPGRTARHRLGR